jgi:enamine deaminase RidA (YjgF/YER057c/UK114 family)
MKRRTIGGTKRESVIGYSRAVRVDPRVSISGTTATDAEGEVVAGDAYERTARAIANVHAEAFDGGRRRRRSR